MRRFTVVHRLLVVLLAGGGFSFGCGPQEKADKRPPELELQPATAGAERPEPQGPELKPEGGLPPAVAGAFYLMPECGAVKISGTRPLYVSALHCFKDEPAVQQVLAESLQLGDLVNYDWLVRYGGALEGLDLSGGRRLLASGREWTGFALDVMKGETEEHVAAAAAALLRDWVIFSDPAAVNATAAACLPVGAAPAVGTAIMTMGRGERRLPESDAPAVSRGHVLGVDFVDGKAYRFRDQWTKTTLAAIRREMGAGTFVLTDAEVHPGMSGGPVVDTAGRLLGVTTVKLEPNFCNLPSEDCLSYLYATHGAVGAAGILAARPELEELFDCPDAPRD